MKVLVTGGAGFIGSNFVHRSLETRPDLEILVLDKLTYAGSMANLAPVLGDIEFIEGDVCDADLIDRKISEVDLVIHFAAESHNDNSLKRPDIFFETNLLGTLNVAKSCTSHGVRLHHVSTDEVFGDLPLESASQFSLASPYNPSSPYSASKAASDHVVRAWVRSFGLQATISNCSNNYGPMQNWEKLIPNTIRALALGNKAQVYGSGLNVRGWIHVDDHTDGIWTAVDFGAVGSTYLFGARDTVSNIKIVQSILDGLGLGASMIDFVDDRPGHDLKYAIDPSSAEALLQWKPKYNSVIEHMPELLTWYQKKLRDNSLSR